jgi:PKD repeat protein
MKQRTRRVGIKRIERITIKHIKAVKPKSEVGKMKKLIITLISVVGILGLIGSVYADDIGTIVIQGRVTDTDDGVGIPEVIVRAGGFMGDPQDEKTIENVLYPSATYTEADGSYSLNMKVGYESSIKEPLTVTLGVEVKRDGYKREFKEIGEYTVGETKTIDFQLTKDEDFQSAAGEATEAADGNQPPVVKISAEPTEGEAPLEVTFSSEGSYDPEGVQLQFMWDFGDGGSSQEANPLHTYQDEGEYEATLTALDGEKITTASITIEVGDIGATGATATIKVRAINGSRWIFGGELPVADVLVIITRTNSAASSLPYEYTANTDDKGECSVDIGIPAGEANDFRIVAQKENFNDATEIIEGVKEGNTKEVKLVLKPSVKQSGVVIATLIAEGTVYDLSGNPAKGAKVYFWPHVLTGSWYPTRAPDVSTTTDKDGHYVLMGNIKLNASFPNYATNEVLGGLSIQAELNGMEGSVKFMSKTHDIQLTVGNDGGSGGGRGGRRGRD